MPAGDQFISIVLKQFWIVNNIQKQTGCDIQNLYSKIWKKNRKCGVLILNKFRIYIRFTLNEFFHLGWPSIPPKFQRYI